MRASTVFLIILFSTVSFAGGIETVIVPPAEIPQAGKSTVFAVYFHNFSDTYLQVDIPESMMCHLSAGDDTVDVKAYATRTTSEKKISICPGCFEKVQYTLDLPSTIEGPVTMEIPDFNNTHTMFAVNNSDSMKASKSNETAPKEFETLDPLYELYQPYLKNIAAYEPMYFLVGTDPKKSKFQFSFKYRLFNAEKDLAQRYPWVKGFHIAYTQTSFWDLKSDSKPFEDTSYKPEFFFSVTQYQASLGHRILYKGRFSA